MPLVGPLPEAVVRRDMVQLQPLSGQAADASSHFPTLIYLLASPFLQLLQRRIPEICLATGGIGEHQWPSGLRATLEARQAVRISGRNLK